MAFAQLKQSGATRVANAARADVTRMPNHFHAYAGAAGATRPALGYSLYSHNPHTNMTATTLTDGTAIFVPVYVPAACTITGVKWFQTTAGNYTADNNSKVGLYTIELVSAASGAGLLYVQSQATCADDASLWKATSNTFATKAFSSTYAASAGVYYVGLLWNASATTTAPAILSHTVATTGTPSEIWQLPASNASLIPNAIAKTDLDSARLNLNSSSTASPWVVLY